MSAPSAKKRTLLVVEDDPGLQSQLKWCFEDYDVTVVGDRETAVTQVRRLEPAVPQDLETTCLAALEKDPGFRYQRMEDLAADLQRFLEFVPVKARPLNWVQRVGRFVRRKPAMSAAIGLAAAIAVALPIGLLWANRAIALQRDLAEDNAA